MAAHLGAHETMEVHEILTSTIDGINLFQLYRPHVKDQQLLQILDRQLQFMINEYNQTVQMLNNQGNGQAVPYRTVKNIAPIYGLNNPAAQTPNISMNQMDDRDVASGMLGCHKASASMKMIAALECADPQLRRTMQQGAVNCAEQAYEVWQYMNQNGHYQVPTMKEMTTNTVLNSYQPTTMNNMNMPQMQQQTMAPMNTMNTMNTMRQ
ncbi:spore coat protein [Paenibacillus beijingensis]|uniref:Coat protein F n=1 Tax=Paenibacillus beijingensis TaxID=1126833 RepID=A0A0D5NLU5_9BACL|nr:spore coat protein [Paenibacillus beijingensis]AJY76299.1 coat protein F [Paenibacillus beijingensis]